MSLHRALAPVLAFAALANTAYAQTVRVRPQQLPPELQTALQRGDLRRVSGATTDTVRAAGAFNADRSQLLAAITGTEIMWSSFRRDLPAQYTAGIPMSDFDTSAASAVDSIFRLPFSYAALTTTSTRPTAFHPIYYPSRPLRFASALGRFEGGFLVGLAPDGNPSRRLALPSPVELIFTANADSVIPQTLAFDSIGTTLQAVRIVTRNALDTLHLHIIPRFDTSGVDVPLPVNPAVVFDAHPRRAQGFGVDVVPLPMRLMGSSMPAIAVSVSSTGGTVVTTPVQLDQGAGIARLRTSGPLDSVTISASPIGSGSAFDGASTWVVFVAPWLFAGFAVGGAVVGALYAILRSDKKPTWRQFASSALGAVIAVAAYYFLGISLVQFAVAVPLASELAVAAFAALGAAFGLKAIKEDGVAQHPPAPQERPVTR